ncbi:hypothetical protein QTP86_026952 [Hemibagrus guttatus]|nr:hypothetical protein QTP86_026952 [Hemibagrus guttatus]
MMSEQEALKRNRGGVQRVEGKLRASVERGDYYEAHQMYRTLFFRYTSQSKHAEAQELMYNGALLFFSYNQQNSAADLSMLFLEALEKSKAKVEEEILEQLVKLFSMMDPNSPERVAFVSRALKWSTGGSGKLGHPKLHQLLAVTLWKEQNYSESRYHFLHSSDGEGCAQMLVEYSAARGYRSEVDMFVAQAVLQISRRSQGLEGVRFWDHRISSLIFADDVVLLASSGLDLQHALGRFAAECEAAGMRVSTSKSEAMVLDRKKVACTLQVGGEVLPQVEEFKYLGVLFTSEGRMDREIDRRIGAAAAVMRSMYRSVVVKKELSRKAKLSIYQSIYVPTLTYGHELWVMTERVRSRIQAAEMSFLRRVAGRSLRDRVRSSVTREELGVEPLFLHIERGQLRWLGHLFRMLPGRLPREVFRACPTGKRPRGRPRTRWRDCLSAGLGTPRGPPEELEEVAREREVWASLLRLFLCLKNKTSASVVFTTYTQKHPSIEKGPPFVQPLLNFLWFLLLAVDGGKLTVFTVLCEQYQPSLKRDPMYNEYLDRIGQLFFGVPPKQSSSYGGLLGRSDISVRALASRTSWSGNGYWEVEGR